MKHRAPACLSLFLLLSASLNAGAAREKSYWIAGRATQLIGDIGFADAIGAIPALREALAANNCVSVYAAEALWKLDPRNNPALPFLVRALQDKDQLTPLIAATVLGNMGHKAKDAVPALIEALKAEDEGLRTAASEALQKVDPEAAAKAGVK